MAWVVAAAVVLHNAAGLLLGYGIPYLLRQDPRTCRTLAIEVGMQNSGLAVALAVKYFGSAAALPGALFSRLLSFHGVGHLPASRIQFLRLPLKQ